MFVTVDPERDTPEFMADMDEVHARGLHRRDRVARRHHGTRRTATAPGMPGSTARRRRATRCPTPRSSISSMPRAGSGSASRSGPGWRVDARRPSTPSATRPGGPIVNRSTHRRISMVVRGHRSARARRRGSVVGRCRPVAGRRQSIDRIARVATLSVEGAWARVSPMMERAGAAYMVIRNSGTDGRRAGGRDLARRGRRGAPRDRAPTRAAR